jgi:hypothetical protein
MEGDKHICSELPDLKAPPISFGALQGMPKKSVENTA